MAGAMSHLDTFGPKPDAPDIQGPTKSISTSEMELFCQKTYLKQLNKHLAHYQNNEYKSRSHERSYLMHKAFKKRYDSSSYFWQLGIKTFGSINRTIPSNIKIGGRGGAGFLESKYGALPINNQKMV